VCSRFRIVSEQIRETFNLRKMPPFEGSHNVAPTELAPVIGQSKEGERIGRLMRFGLIPSWAKEASFGNRAINARSESLTEKPAFKEAFKHRRCIVPADGFYEWFDVTDPTLQVQLFGGVASKSRSNKQPVYITPAEGGLFALAGLWDRWKGPDGWIESFTVITGEPNDLVAKFHERMPAILQPKDFDLWLDRNFENTEALQAILADPYPAEAMKAVLVSQRVNSPRYKEADCIEPLAS
jgi:putative SOS response-associated peptidase YedK